MRVRIIIMQFLLVWINRENHNMQHFVESIQILLEKQMEVIRIILITSICFSNTDFIGEANGSDKNYSFLIPAEKMSDKVHVFESAIDLLSYATMQKLDGKEWRTEHLLSLAGVYQPAKEIERSKVPAALTRFLKEHSDVKEIVLHLDNDRTGRLATKAIQTVVPKKYRVKDQPPTKGKDCNDMLCLRLNLGLTRREKSKNQKSNRSWER